MAQVRTALAQAFMTPAFFAPEDVAWENLPFTPRGGSHPWARFSFLPNTPDVDTLGVGGVDRVDAVAQVDLNYPLGTGDADAMAKYVAMTAVFYAGARFTSSGQVVIIKSCGRSPGREFGGYYRVSVTIQFYAQIPR